MPHFYIKPENISDKKFVISRKDAHHLVDVMRSSVGDIIDCFDGTGKVFKGKITRISREDVEGTLTEEKMVQSGKRSIVLYCAVPKGDRFDWLCEKASELGVSEIVPLVTSRSVFKEISIAKIERWQRISVSASEQSNRADIMQIGKPVEFGEAVKKENATNSLRIIPWESESSLPMIKVLNDNKKTEKVELFIGPEGGFTEKEIKTADEHGIIPVTLGETILRVETAALVSAILSIYNS